MKVVLSGTTLLNNEVPNLFCLNSAVFSLDCFQGCRGKFLVSVRGNAHRCVSSGVPTQITDGAKEIRIVTKYAS